MPVSFPPVCERVILQQEVKNPRLSAAGGGARAQGASFQGLFFRLYMTNLIETHKYHKVKEGWAVFVTVAAPNRLSFLFKTAHEASVTP